MFNVEGRALLPVPRRAAVGARLCALAFAGFALAACSSQTTWMGGGTDAPDAIDRIRGVDLQPRFPKNSGTANTGQGGDRAQLYYGSASPDAGAPGGGAGMGGGAAGGEGIDLNFDNAPIASVAKVILGDVLGVGYAVDPRVQGTITLSSGRPVPKSQLIFVLESALRTSNAVLVKDSGGYRIIPIDDAVGNGVADRAPHLEPGYGMTVIPVRHVSVQNVSKLLEGFATRPGAIRADPGGNLIVVVGTSVERRTAVDTILSFDQDWMRGQSVGIIPVRNSTPEPMVAELEKILDSGEAGMSQSMVKFQPITRSNAILVVAKKPELLRAAATWIARLDGSSAASTGVKVYRVRYGDARQIAKLLSDLFTGGGGGGDSAANQLAPGSGSLSATDRLTGGGSAAGGGSGSGMGANSGSSSSGLGSSSSSGLGSGSGSGSSGFGGQGQSPFGTLGNAAAGGEAGKDAAGGANAALSGGSSGSRGPVLLPGVRIMADTVNNSVVIYANPSSYRVIEKALEQLDRPKLQVAVDLTIAEVTLNDTLNYGVQFFLGSSNLGLGTNNGFVTNTASSVPLAQTSGAGGTTPGFNVTIGNALSPRVIINALHQYTDVKVLSNPSLVVVDNQVATLQVGDEIPIQTGSATVLSANNAVVNTIDYKNTGIILRVQPRVNFNGNVSLDVEQEISNQAGTSALGPTFSQRKVKSSILVASGQTVLLAGLISDGVNGTRASIPVADQIPVLGNLFTNSSNRLVGRTELIIFIRPQIIRDGVDASFVAEELRSKMRGDKVGGVYPTGAVLPTPPRALQ